MGPLASGVPMGASHGIGYVLGALFDIPHGHTSCIMLPAVMRWNKPVNAERQALVAAAMGHPGEDAGDVLDAFIAGLGMPRSLGAVRIGPESFARLAEGRDGDPVGPAQPPAHCRARATAGDPGAGGVSALALNQRGCGDRPKDERRASAIGAVASQKCAGAENACLGCWPIFRAGR